MWVVFNSFQSPERPDVCGGKALSELPESWQMRSLGGTGCHHWLSPLEYTTCGLCPLGKVGMSPDKGVLPTPTSTCSSHMFPTCFPSPPSPASPAWGLLPGLCTWFWITGMFCPSWLRCYHTPCLFFFIKRCKLCASKCWKLRIFHLFGETQTGWHNFNQTMKCSLACLERKRQIITLCALLSPKNCTLD